VDPIQQRRIAEILLKIDEANTYADLRNASNIALQTEFGWSKEEADHNLGQMCESELQSDPTPPFRWRLLGR
jgi:hypothetical protein